MRHTGRTALNLALALILLATSLSALGPGASPAHAASLSNLQVTDGVAVTRTVNWTRPANDPAVGLNLKVVAGTTGTEPSLLDIVSGRISPASETSFPFSTSSLPPGSYYVRAEYDTDFATAVRGDTWDMKSSSDVAADGAGSNATLNFSSGVMSGTNKDSDPYFHLAFSPTSPISATVFNKLSFRMTSPKADFFQVLWKRAGESDYKSISPFLNPTLAGVDKVYTVDFSGNSDWSGNIQYLRIDPIHNASAGETWQIDWVALDPTGVTRTTEPSLTTIHTATTFTITSAGPHLSITTPSAEAPPTLPEGDDYAKTVLGDAWDMNEITDIRQERSYNVTDVAVSNGILSFKSGTDSSPYNAVKTPTNPQVVLLYPGYVGSDGSSATQNIGKLGQNYPIDATKYKQLSFRMYLSSVVSSGANRSQARVIWANGSSFVPSAYSAIGTSKGILVYEGWHTYTVDLSTIGLDSGTVVWGDSASGGATMKGLRLDPTTDAGVTIMIDWVRLTPTDTASTTQSVSWTRPGDSTTAVVNLSVVTDTTAPAYATIREGLLSSGDSSYNWGTANLPPGRYYAKAEIGNDWATMFRGDAWDMSQVTDIYTTTQQLKDTTVSVSDGILSGTTTSTDNYIYLNYSPATPISGTVFSKVSFRMYSPIPYYYFLVWYTDDDPTTARYYFANPSTGALPSTTVGWRTYTIDMSSEANWFGKNIRYIRLSPLHDYAAGQTWQMDWFTIGISGSTPGDMNKSTAASPGTMTVNNAPTIQVTKPSMSTGEDYASSVVGNPWDWEDSADILDDRTPTSDIDPTPISRIVDIGPYDFTSGNLNGVTKGTVSQITGGVAESDNQIWLNTGVVKDKSDSMITTGKYKYLTWRFYQEGNQNTTQGWVSRVIWWNQGLTQDSSVTKDIVIDEGWNNYKLDMSQAGIEPVSASVPSAYGWKDSMKYIRFDPNEIANTAGTLTSTFHLDYVKLTAPDVAYDSFDIRWVVNGGTIPTVTLYYDTDTNSSNGMTAITTVPAAAGAYTWDASAVAEGTYYVYAKVQDAYNSSGRYSESPVIVKRSPTVTITQPAGSAPAVAVGGDYATNVQGNAWDMSGSSDIYEPVNLSGSFGGGLYVATTTSSDPQLILANYFKVFDPAKQIDASKYKKLTFRMFLSSPGLWQVTWSSTAGVNNSTTLAVARKGWNTYSVDLSSQTGWSGSIKFLRLDPVDQAGLTVKIAWIKLTDPSSSSQGITWSASNLGSSTISLYYDTQASGRNGNLIASGLTGTSYTWDTSALAPGNYYVYAKAVDSVGPGVYGAYSGVPVKIGSPPAEYANKVFLPTIMKAATGW